MRFEDAAHDAGMLPPADLAPLAAAARTHAKLVQEDLASHEAAMDFMCSLPPDNPPVVPPVPEERSVTPHPDPAKRARGGAHPQDTAPRGNTIAPQAPNAPIKPAATAPAAPMPEILPV